MATFGWAYINCEDSGSASTGGQADGPTGSIQFLTGSNATSGSTNFLWYTASYGGYSANTLVLTGTLVVTGAISASHFHIENIAVIDATGSTYFGNSSDDSHVRTGSLYISQDTILGSDQTANHKISGSLQIYGSSSTSGPILDIEYYETTSILKVPGLRVTYTQITDIGGTTGSASDYVVGIRAGDANTNYRLPSASLAGTGSLRVIKDEMISRAGTQIYISCSSPDTIDGQASYILSGTMPAINLYSDGHDWYIF
jgi:hypothetical protein